MLGKEATGHFSPFQASLILLRPSAARTTIYTVIAVTDIRASTVGEQISNVPATPEVQVQIGDLFAIFSPTRNPIPFDTSGTDVCQNGVFYTVRAPSRLAVGSVLPLSELVVTDCRIYSVQIMTEPGEYNTNRRNMYTGLCCLVVVWSVIWDSIRCLAIEVTMKQNGLTITISHIYPCLTLKYISRTSCC